MHVVIEVVRPLAVFDTGIRPKIKHTVPGVRGRI